MERSTLRSLFLTFLCRLIFRTEGRSDLCYGKGMMVYKRGGKIMEGWFQGKNIRLVLKDVKIGQPKLIWGRYIGAKRIHYVGRMD